MGNEYDCFSDRDELIDKIRKQVREMNIKPD